MIFAINSDFANRFAQVFGSGGEFEFHELSLRGVAGYSFDS
jgi:hypothetical protein